MNMPRLVRLCKVNLSLTSAEIPKQMCHLASYILVVSMHDHLHPRVGNQRFLLSQARTLRSSVTVLGPRPTSVSHHDNHNTSGEQFHLKINMHTNPGMKRSPSTLFFPLRASCSSTRCSLCSLSPCLLVARRT